MSDIAALILGAYIAWSGLMTFLNPPIFMATESGFITGNQYRVSAVVITTFQLILIGVILSK